MSSFIKLGNYTQKIGSGLTPLGGQSSYFPSGIPLIRSQNVLMGSFTKEGLAFISPQQDEQMSGSRVERGDVLLNITGASIGRVCVVPSEVCPANVNQHVCIIRCSESLDPEYVAAFLASPDFQSFIWQSQAGGTRQALTKEMIEVFEIPFKSLDEQRRIAAHLKAQLAAVEDA
ncbi:MAG TPA: restriction endonuclease subunit S, partial [Blastocatellia bacterium]